ncbi:MAG: cadherin domain-containing protein [Chloroflexi bacterium]|nr:cadherin domain-containing protein [Chloroflexota bacterium]
MFAVSGGLVGAQDAGAIEYAENDTGAVATFTATDPEEEDITWSLTHEGTADFKITGGVLEFISPPDFEAPAGGASDDSNTYTVTVNASAGTSDVATISTVSREVTVNVTNVDEPGSIMLSTLQPQVEIAITATLSDPDNPDQTAVPLTELEWEWLRGQDVIAGATGATYTPRTTDVGSVLTARATYKDAQDADNNKTAEIESAHMVRATPASQTAPTFLDQDPDNTGNQQTRMVAENTPAGQDIGAAVEATDPGDVLTYSLSGTNADLFALDRATGQLRTKGALNRETIGDPFTQTVIVTATDPWGASATVTVTLSVTNVDEAPAIAANATTAITSPEGTTAAPLTLTTALATYTATEPETEAMTWSLSGADAATFNIGNQTGATPGELTFKAQPDFESPGDANTDNVYEVTVVVSDPARNSDEVAVRVTVTNVAETGTITFSSLQPKTGIPLTASLTDPDGGITNLEWQWENGGTEIEDATSATYTPVVGDITDTLTVTATYRDNSLAAGAAAITLESATTPAVVADTDNKAPVFPDQDTEMDGRQTDQERMIAELTDARAPTPAGTTIGDPVAAEVDNTLTPGGTEVPDVLTYSLGGTDAASFSIARNTGQLSTKAALNYETKQSYSVTVTATDPGGLSATVNVTIKVNDINEDPVLTGEAPAQYAENGTAPVTTFRATDPEGEDIVWTLTGTDEQDFTIVGGVLRFASSPNFEAAADANTDNTYEITVNASDGTNSATEDLTIAVTNVEEPGTVTLSTLQPQVGVSITAELNDVDAGGTTANPTWMWLRGGSVIVGATTDRYQPEDGDVGSVLTAKATYTDAEDAVTNKTAQGRSSRAVRRAPTGGTSAPVFPDQNPSTEAVETEQTRMVAENTPAGRNIGGPVNASDRGDVLTYSLSGADAGLFALDRATGQLRTKGALNREASGGDSHTVIVTATDPGGLTATSEVTITVTNVDEAPAISTTGSEFRDISSDEGTAATPLDLATALATYAATEPEDEDMTWSLSGADAGTFNIGNQDGGTPGVLTFKAQPDFESPGDANSDNVYELTVVVSDPAKNSDEVAVRVTVTNVAETGTITYSSLQPKAGIPLTATLNDPDGGITGLMWQWTNGTDGAIKDATSATYTPVAGDIGDTLTVTATYRDGSLAASAAAIELESAATPAVVADTDNKAPRFPDQDAATEGRQTDHERSVPENYATGDSYGDPAVSHPNIGAPVAAEVDNTLAPDGTATADTLTYSLGGTDAASFNIVRASGQLEAKSALDKEMKDTYTVTVTATDPGGLSATVNVTITVTNVDEPPTIMVGGLAISGDRSVEVVEGTTAVASYTATGPNAANTAWTLSGDDAGALSIDRASGVLTLAAMPDFEAPADADMDNVYTVTVEADDGTYSSTRDVTVTVTNEPEDGTLTVPSAPMVDTPVMAELDDPDGVTPGSEVWVWESENSDGTFSVISGATTASYTPVAADQGKILRVTVTYTDGFDADNELTLTEETGAVAAADPLLAEYDPNGDGTIEKEDMRRAVGKFFAIPQTLSTDDMRRLVGIYFS